MMGDPQSTEKSIKNTVENQAFCILPWVHMYVDPTGNVFSCCLREYGAAPFGNINTQTPEEIWNSEAFRQMRLDFLAGKSRPDNCQHCYFAEANGNQSHRLQYNRQFKAFIDQAIAGTDATGRVKEMKLRFWDFRFSNVCNLKCRTCGPDYSSSWRGDSIRLGWREEREAVAIRFDNYRFAISQIPHVTDIYFAGGEPLLMKEHFEILNELIRQKRTDVRLSYNSNFSTLSYAKHDIVPLWRHFRTLSLSPSIDHFGAKGEYIRKGLDWSRFVENVARVRRELPFADVRPTVTVSIFNILDITEIHRELVRNDVIKRDDPAAVCFNVLRAPEYYSAGVLPPELKARVRDQIEAYVSDVEARTGIRIQEFEKVLGALKNDATDQLPMFFSMTEKLDQVRQESFLELFPEYLEYARSTGR